MLSDWFCLLLVLRLLVLMVVGFRLIVVFTVCCRLCPGVFWLFLFGFVGLCCCDSAVIVLCFVVCVLLGFVWCIIVWLFCVCFLGW